jgi:hypothetical protein
VITKEDLAINLLANVLDAGNRDVNVLLDIILTATNDKFKLDGKEQYLVDEDFYTKVYENVTEYDLPIMKLNIHHFIATAYECIVNAINNWYKIDITKYIRAYPDGCASTIFFDKDTFIADNEDMLQQADEIEAIINQF